MKKAITLLTVLLMACTAFGQAITIQASDMPVPTATFNILDLITANPPNATAGANAHWDYSSYHTTAAYTVAYTAETDTFFTHAGVAITREVAKSLIPGLGYLYESEISFDTARVAEKGSFVPQQGYDISAYTGKAGDSINFPAAKQLFATPKVTIKFPFTAGSTWHSASRRTVDFKLTVSAAGLSNAPATHVYYANQTDSIVGWGKLRVYTPSGPSVYYDVLMDKIKQYNVDSFYLYGSPASTSFLSSFGISQGQTSDVVYRTNFYKKGAYLYLFSFYYPDSTYTNPEDAYVCTNDLATATGVSNVAGASYSTVLYPNPSAGSELNLLVTGRSLSVSEYTITDMKGAVVQAGTADMAGKSTLHISLGNNLSNGNYLLQVRDKNLAQLISEQFIIRK